jgi:Glycosyl hydrolase family 26
MPRPARAGWRYTGAFAAIFIALCAGTFAMRTTDTVANVAAPEALPTLATVPHGNMASADAAGVVYGFYVASIPTGDASSQAHSHPTTSPSSVTGPPPGSDSSRVLGVYDGTHSSAGIEATADWLGSSQDVQYAEDFIDDTSWSTISDPSWFISQWQGTPYKMVWGVPMVPCGAPSTECSPNASEFDSVASGADDSYYATLAQNLVAGGFGSSYIRLGWEFQGGWFPWSICNSDGQKDFVAAFRNIVTSMRSVSGANFQFIWNPDDSADTSCSGQLEDYYPGDSYVNMVALDVYDMNGAEDTDSARWTDMLNGVNAGGWTATAPQSINGQSFKGYGLNWLDAFANEHGKEIGLPEWGLWSSDNDGGGDDPYFVNEMASWIKTYATGPTIFWNYDDGADGTVLTIPNETTGAVPDASSAFRSDFEGY